MLPHVRSPVDASHCPGQVVAALLRRAAPGLSFAAGIHRDQQVIPRPRRSRIGLLLRAHGHTHSPHPTSSSMPIAALALLIEISLLTFGFCLLSTARRPARKAPRLTTH